MGGETTENTFSRDIITRAFGALGNPHCTLSETELKQRDASIKARESRLARKEKQRQILAQELESKHQSDEEHPVVNNQDDEKHMVRAEEKNGGGGQEAKKKAEEQALLAKKEEEFANTLKQQQLQWEQTLQKEQQEKLEMFQMATAFQLACKQQEESIEALKKQLQTLLSNQTSSSSSSSNTGKTAPSKEQQERAKIADADRFANGGGAEEDESNVHFDEQDLKQDSSQNEKPTSTNNANNNTNSNAKPKETDDEIFERNAQMAKVNAMRAAYIQLNFAARSLETGNGVFGKPLALDGLSERIQTALEGGKFNDSLTNIASQPWAMKYLTDPVIGLGTTFVSELMAVHIDNKKALEKAGMSGYRNKAKEEQQQAQQQSPPQQPPQQLPQQPPQQSPQQQEEQHQQTKSPQHNQYGYPYTHPPPWALHHPPGCFCALCRPPSFNPYMQPHHHHHHQQPQASPWGPTPVAATSSAPKNNNQQHTRWEQRLAQHQQTEKNKNQSSSECSSPPHQAQEPEQQKQPNYSSICENEHKPQPPPPQVENVHKQQEDSPLSDKWVRKEAKASLQRKVKRSYSLERSRHREAQQPSHHHHRRRSPSPPPENVIVHAPESSENLVVDRQSGSVRPSFTTTPKMRSMVSQEYVASIKDKIEAFGPILGGIPDLMEMTSNNGNNKQAIL